MTGRNTPQGRAIAVRSRAGSDSAPSTRVGPQESFIYRRVAARTSPATARDRLCGGHAITVVTAGASSTGTAARSPRSWARHDSGRTAEARPSAISWNSCAVSRTCAPGPSGYVPSWRGPARHRQPGQRGDVGHPDVRPAGEGMPGRQDHHLPLGAQLLGVEPGRRVERQVQQRHVGPPVAQQPLLFGRPAQEHVDGDRAGFGGVRVEQLRQQLAGRPGLRDEDQARVAGRGEGGAPGTAVGGVDRVEGGPALAQQHRSGLGQRDAAAGAFQQPDPEPPFELPDRPRQRRLRDPEALRGPPEVQLLGDGDEVPQLPRLHAATVRREPIPGRYRRPPERC